MRLFDHANLNKSEIHPILKNEDSMTSPEDFNFFYLFFVVDMCLTR